ncbi:hypothetical protein ZYGR_0AG05540 [Zygosaccharomyces rouxii]|uniref:SRR1-like domain-containing protein n=1 Tax=Zygosaccharomyces rouxii TaxID=4956 RepID=A0A1Q3AAE7_ZYGRO|nr:hypothetical protein ZYGR_0AG05540 [Zygosaccharomyces rouxii]
MGFSKSKRQVSQIAKKRDFSEVLGEYRHEIKKSQMFKELCQSLEAYRQHIVRVRCLAIGSFHEEFPAKWQLALLMEVLDYLNASNPSVSLYDPVFTEEDLRFVSLLEGWSVDERISPEWIKDSSRTLFFLPHAPLDLTELVLGKEQPKYWLANHFVAHTDRYTKLQLFETYPLISKLVNSLSETDSPRDQAASQDEFTTFVSRRRRKNRQTYQEPKLDYSSIGSSFQKCQLLQDFQRGELLKDQPWINSFSDLALHLID